MMFKAASHAVTAGWHSLYMPEAMAWVAALLAMALMEPGEAHLFSFCPFSYVLEWCPGCGLGHSIAWLFRGEVAASWQAHPLGAPAVLLLSFRSGRLFYMHYRNQKSEL